jgi:hypothetical protein
MPQVPSPSTEPRPSSSFVRTDCKAANRAKKWAASVTLRPLYYPKAIQEQQTQRQSTTTLGTMQGVLGDMSPKREERAASERLTVQSRARKATSIWLGSLVFEVQDDLENIRSKGSGVQAIHVGKHDDAGPPFRCDEDCR